MEPSHALSFQRSRLDLTALNLIRKLCLVEEELPPLLGRLQIRGSGTFALTFLRCFLPQIWDSAASLSGLPIPLPL